jgi:hypothetical protein
LPKVLQKLQEPEMPRHIDLVDDTQ